MSVHEKRGKQKLKIYRQISLVLIYGKLFEWSIYNETYQCFTENNLLSGFKPGDLPMNQLVFITNDIDKSFNEGYEVTGVIDNILKTFDKVCMKISSLN